MRKLFISSGIPLFYFTFLIILNGSISRADNLQQPHVNEFVFYPNERCTILAYTDSINCGSSKNSLIQNSQSAIVSKLQLSRTGVLDEPFAGIEIFFKDTNEMYDISAFDSIDLDLQIINGDTSGFNVMVQQKSRLLSPSLLPPADTFKCGDPRKLPNRRHPYSVKHMQIGVEKYRFRYSMNINSFTTPTWYGEGATLYREQFDKKRFYSFSIQTGSNVPQGVEYTVIITRIAFRKNTPEIYQASSAGRFKIIPDFLIWLVSVVSLLLIIIFLIITIQKKQSANSLSNISPEKEKKIFDYINNNLGNSALTENDVASHIGVPPEIVKKTLRLAQNMRTEEYINSLRLRREAEYLFEKNHRHQIEWEIKNNREYTIKSELRATDEVRDHHKDMPEPVEYDDASRKVMHYFRDNYQDLKLDDEKRDDDALVDSRIAKVIDMPLDDIRKILEACFGISNKKYPICHHLKVLRIEIAKRIMEFYIKNARETYALKWLYSKVGFKEQDRLTKAWKETLNMIDETPNKFQDRLNKQNN